VRAQSGKIVRNARRIRGRGRKVLPTAPRLHYESFRQGGAVIFAAFPRHRAPIAPNLNRSVAKFERFC